MLALVKINLIYQGHLKNNPQNTFNKEILQFLLYKRFF